MSANPTRANWSAISNDGSSFSVQEGNRVLESIANQEALSALLAFSELRNQIRNRRFATGRSDQDLFETERFILDEVLQLICDRAQVITQADGMIVALVQPSPNSDLGQPEMVCRAASGPLAVERGVRLPAESKFLQEAMQSGHILRCDDCDTDPRVEMDLAYQMGVRSTLLVPLRGHREQVGVLQAFSTTARAFSTDDIRWFELFAELVLSVLKPADQDRRISWLSDIAGEVLKQNPGAIDRIKDKKPLVETGIAPSATTASVAVPLADLSGQTTSTSAATVELPKIRGVVVDPLEDKQFGFENTSGQANRAAVLAPELKLVRFPQRVPIRTGSRRALTAALGLLSVAALFSAGAWFGMRLRENNSDAKSGADHAAVALRSVTAPSAPNDEVVASAAPDNLLTPDKLDSDGAPLTPLPESKLAGLPHITGVRHWSSSMGSTVVIDMQDQVPYEVHRLMSPERIYFDLHDTALSPELDGKTMDVGDASLTRVRVAQPVAGITRVVLDTKDGSNFSVSMESSPYRLVVELRGSEPRTTQKTLAISHGSTKPATKALSAISAPLPPTANATPAAALAPKSADQPLPLHAGKFRIVLDAGHGGWDLGTVGRQGLLEKDLVLDVTERLGKLLQSRLGADVMLTRTNDIYVPLEQRADFANQAQADLFVSIHANYSTSAAARGVETYYTNVFSAPGSKEAEKHEDGSFAKMTPVSLSAGGLHQKIEESRKLAASVQHSLYATLASNSPDIRNRGIKDSAFVVLTGTTMPSILTEISFVSSPADERNLQSASYRQQIAEALFKGIARYQETAPRSKVAQVQTASVRR